MRRAVYTFTALLSSKNDKKRSNRLPEKSCHFESVGRCRFLPAMKSPLCYSLTPLPNECGTGGGLPAAAPQGSAFKLFR
jgi:hypothetical protein